jgi:hypothetical protein
MYVPNTFGELSSAFKAGKKVSFDQQCPGGKVKVTIHVLLVITHQGTPYPNQKAEKPTGT